MNTGLTNYDQDSERRLREVDQRLKELFNAVAARPDAPKFIITEGTRSAKRQGELFKAGASKLDGITKISKHQKGQAVDVAIVVGSKAQWDWNLYRLFAPIVKDEAARRGIRITWGGDWLSFRDGCHFELR